MRTAMLSYCAIYQWVLDEASPLGPHGWYADYYVYRVGDEYVVGRSDWMTPSTWINWDHDVQVVPWKANYDIPYFPEQYATEELSVLLSAAFDAWDMEDLCSSLCRGKSPSTMVAAVRSSVAERVREIAVPRRVLRGAMRALKALQRAARSCGCETARERGGNCEGDLNALREVLSAVRDAEAIETLREEWAEEITNKLLAAADRLE